MIKELTRQLAEKRDLTGAEMEAAMQEILSGSAITADIALFLDLLSAKGETVRELTSAVQVILKYIDPITVRRTSILDTCGTGGDKKGSFNISTVVAFVASAAGVTVAKHGNRSVSSNCGSADVLEDLGVNIHMGRERIKRCLEEIGIAFLFAPELNPAMKYVMPARKQLAKKTMFNILGPLVSPVRSTNQLVGVYAQQWVRPLAEVLHNLGVQHALVVHGQDGLDEVTLAGNTLVCEMLKGKFSDYEIAPEDYGFSRAGQEEFCATSIAQNSQIVLDILSGKTGSRRDIVLLNAGCAIYAADRGSSIGEGIRLAKEAIDSGKALEKLERLKEYSR